MSFPSFPDLRVLTPPEFNSHCSKCGLLKKLLPWQLSANGVWGAVCNECGKAILLGLLRRQLRSPFSETELMNVFLGLGMGKKESELLFQDLQKEGTIHTRGKGFFLFDDEPAVVRLGSEPKNARKRYRKPTSEEIFLRAVKLSREVIEEEKSR